MVWCASKSGCHKDTCLKEIGLSAQNMLTHSRFDNQHKPGGGFMPSRDLVMIIGSTCLLNY